MAEKAAQAGVKPGDEARFMRIGVNIEAISDNHVMKMNSVLLDHTCAVIGITSWQNPEAITSLVLAKGGWRHCGINDFSQRASAV